MKVRDLKRCLAEGNKDHEDFDDWEIYLEFSGDVKEHKSRGFDFVNDSEDWDYVKGEGWVKMPQDKILGITFNY